MKNIIETKDDYTSASKNPTSEIPSLIPLGAQRELKQQNVQT